MFGFLGKKAQHTAEYAIVVALIISAVAAMQVHSKRALQSRIKGSTEFLQAKNANFALTNIQRGGNAGIPTGQYEPYYLSSDFSVDRKSTETVSVDNAGDWKRNVANEVTNRRAGGWQQYEAPDNVTTP